MIIAYFDKLDPTIRIYLLFAIILGLFSLWILLEVLKKLVDKQIEEQIDKFALQARIPKVFKDRIGVKVKWR